MFPYRLSTSQDDDDKKCAGRKRRGPDRNQDNPARLVPTPPPPPFADGGPLQAAIRADLDELFPQFTSLLAKSVVAAGQDGRTTAASPASAFRAFKTVFQTNKVALLHLFAPPRCDVAAYSQLLYAVCLSMIRDAYLVYRPTSTVFFEHVSYGTFLLYTLYQTNPLPTAPRDGSYNKAQLELLPLGLFDCRNPKESTFARHFRTPIRIDYEHYGYLLRLLDLGMAAVSDQHERQQQQPTSLTLLVPDLLTIVRRLLSADDDNNNMLEFCAYTGPCSLEGLAGHEIMDPHDDARIISTSTAVAPNSSSSNSTNATVMTSFTLSHTIEEQLHVYQTKLGKVRMPPVTANMSNRSKRVRSALEPVFAEDTALARLLAIGKGGPIEAPTTTVAAKSRVTFDLVSEQELQAKDHGPAEDDPAILLPEGLLAAQVESIRLAVRTLVERDEPLLPTKKRRRRYNQHDDDNADDHDAVSHGFASSSVASAFTSYSEAAIGQRALGDLLDRSRAADCGTSFLAVQTFWHDEENMEAVIENLPDTLGGMSDLSSDEELFEEVSMAASRVGQSALQELLKKAAGKRKKREPKARSSPTARQPTTRKRQGPPNKCSDDGGSQVSEACVGKKSLNDLLSRVRGTKVPGGNSRQHRRKAPPKHGTDKRQSTPARTFRDAASVTTHSTQQSDNSTSQMSTYGHNALRKLIDQARTAPTDPNMQDQWIRKVPAVRNLRRSDSSTASIGCESRQSNLGQSTICNLLRQARHPGDDPPLNGNGSLASECMNVDVRRVRDQHCSTDAAVGQDIASLASRSMDSTGHASWQSNVGQNALGGLLQRARAREHAPEEVIDQAAPRYMQ
jgi:hypothetical protein